jgi:hypothetical protein
MSDFRVLSLSGELCGESALSYLPMRGQSPSEWLFHAGGLTAIDAWGATALRTSIEFYARYQARQVTISQPKRAEAWRLLFHVLGNDCPAHVRLSDDADAPTGRSAPTAIILPAVRIPSVERADAIAAALLATASGRLAWAIRFMASQVPELALNALTHGEGSPTHPVLCMFYDREEDQVQLVVCDLGSRYDSLNDADQALRADVAEQSDGALTTAVELAVSRGIDATLTVAAGNGRLYWRRGKWTSTKAVAIPGFGAALTVQVG